MMISIEREESTDERGEESDLNKRFSARNKVGGYLLCSRNIFITLLSSYIDFQASQVDAALV